MKKASFTPFLLLQQENIGCYPLDPMVTLLPLMLALKCLKGPLLEHKALVGTATIKHVAVTRANTQIKSVNHLALPLPAA